MPLLAEQECDRFLAAEMSSADAPSAFALSYRRIVLLCLCAAYAGLFCLSYEWVESPLYSYTGLAYAPPSSLFVVLGFAMALLPSNYWEYFSSHPHNDFAGGSTGRLLGSPAGLSASQTIGLNYFGTSEANANANIWMSAFFEAGYAGMLVVTICAGVLLKLFDGMLRHSPLFGAMVVACMATAWAEGAFQTSLLSRGVAPTLVVLLFVPITLAVPEADRTRSEFWFPSLLFRAR
jgi:hypothetical protein